MVEEFKAPTFELKGKRTVELNFSAAVAAGAHLSIVSGAITYPFRITRAKMVFTEDANNWIVHQWYVSGNVGVSTTGPPSGTNIFGRENPTQQFIGKAIIRTVHCSVEVEEEMSYLKLYTHNTGPYAYTVNCSITIEEM